MNKIICLSVSLLAFSFSAGAAYVSPTIYKDFSCEELNADHQGHAINSMDKKRDMFDLSLDSSSRGALRDELKIAEFRKDAEISAAHVKAIAAAAKKINCSISKIKD
jgi:hypothetical protein